ncbi:MAG: methionine--tRNA ligase [Burkholderiales bacterium]|nr:methionine--tRNA ligase [Burkholderiales bacterium]
MPRKLLVTSALPYANGAIHLGHLVEYIQTDIWVRFQRMQGHEVLYVCADDTHGTPIMLRAQAEGITPEALIERVYGEHTRDFFGGESAAAGGKLGGFMVSFDNYHTTNSPENRAFCEDIYRRLKERGLIDIRSVEQFFDPVKAMFLPDRYIKGECPKCGAKDQYGDSCEACGSTYAPTDLKHPYSAVSGAAPVRKASEHHFFRLSDPRCEQFLRAWTQGGQHVQPEAGNKLKEWLGAPGENKLADWDISRDPPYFGFAIPDTGGSKFFYVWLDAPVGYFGSFRNYCERTGKSQAEIDAYLRPGGDTELVHFIGKDILYFHALFWPAMLEHAGYRTPSKVYAHGFLTVNGEKMSKSRGTFITAQSYLELGLNPEWLRYYYAAKLGSTMEDIDLSLDDFVARVNSDLVGKYVNIASRAAGFISRQFDGELAYAGDTVSLVEGARATAAAVRDLYDAREFGKAMRLVMETADRINQEYDRHQPWLLAKDPQRRGELQDCCARALYGFKLLSVLLAPVLPRTAQNVARSLFGMERDFAWDDALALPERIQPYRHLMTRIDAKQVSALIEANKESLQPVLPASPARHGEQQQHAEKPATAAHITIEDFAKLDLRVARIADAEHVEGADKLLKLTLDVGALGTRTVFAGIKAAYDPATLKDRLTVMVANLAPRKMKFGISEGMILAASDDSGGPFLLAVDDGAKPGMKAK